MRTIDHVIHTTMAVVPTVEELLLRLPSELVDKVCSEEHLMKLTDHFSEWVNVATYLGLTDVEKRDIELNWPRDVRRQRNKMLSKWKETQKERATYRALVKAFHKAKQANVICKLADDLKQDEVDSATCQDTSQSSAKGSTVSSTSDSTKAALLTVPTLRRLSELHELSLKWYILGEELQVSEEQLEKLYELEELDEHSCMVRMFGIWLRECQPSYEKLIVALIAIDERNVAALLCEEQGVSFDEINKTYTENETELDYDSQSDTENEIASNLLNTCSTQPLKDGIPKLTDSEMKLVSQTEPPQKQTARLQLLRNSITTPMSSQKPPSVPLLPPPPPPECVTKYATYLKTRYKRMSALPTPKWPPTVKEAVQLALIEKERDDDEEKQESMKWDYIHGKVDNIVAKKKEIGLVDVFRVETSDTGVESIPLKVLMDGAPGVGKTTLTRKACIDWASGEMLQQYSLVVLVPLREAKYRKAKSIEDLLPCDSLKLKQQVIEHIEVTSGKHVLFILDGFDELSAEERRQDSLFLDIIRGDCMSECTVLVTSRPYASDCLQRLECVNRHVEVLGFTQKQISSCITRNISDKEKAAELISELNKRLDIASLCYVPLNCAIIIYVYQQKRYTLPSTLTDLFNDFIFYCLKRHATVVLNNEHLERQLTKPNDTLPKKLAEQLSALSELAYKKLVEDSFVIDYNELQAVFPEHLLEGNCSVESRSLGLISSSTNSFTNVTHYQFLHLSIQEFLAAKYVFDRLTSEEQLQFFLDHLQNERFQLMLLFLAGLTKLNFGNCQELFENESFKLISKRFLYLAHLVFESQCINLYKVLLQCLEDKERFWCIIKELTLFDCILIAHFLCSVDHSWKTLILNGCSLSSHSIKVFNEVRCRYHHDSGMSTFETIILNQNHCDIQLLLPLLPWLSHATKLYCANSLPHAESAIAQYQSSSETISQTYITLLQSNTYLRVLDFHGSSVTDSVAEGIAAGLTGNVMLEIVDLGENHLSFSTVERILSSLNGCSAPISCLTMCGLQLVRTRPYNAWRVQVTTEKKLSKYCIDLCLNILQRLDLNQAEISCYGVADVFQSLGKNNGLQVLKLSGFQILEGNDHDRLNPAVTNILSSAFNYSSNALHLLQICGVELTRDVSQSTWKVNIMKKNEVPQFFCALSNSLMIRRVQLPQTLDLSEAGLITSQRAVAIFQLMEKDTSVEELSLELHVDISEEVSYAIRRMLELNTTLKKLDLQGCSVGDAIVQAIIDGLTRNSSLKEISLGSYAISSINISAILSAANSSKSLCRVCVCDTLISRKQPHGGHVWKLQATNNLFGPIFMCGLEKSSIARSMQMPHTVDMHDTHLTSSSAVSIFQLLEHNTDVVRLDLSRNNLLTKDDCEAVGCAVKRMLDINTTLETLDLHGCSLGDTIVLAIAGGLTKNSSMKTINLNYDYTLSEKAVITVLSSANSNTSLRNIYVCGAHLSRQQPLGVWVIASTFKSYNLFKNQIHFKLIYALISENFSPVCYNILLKVPCVLNMSNAGLTCSSIVSMLKLFTDAHFDVMKLDLSGNDLSAKGDNTTEDFDATLKQILQTRPKKSISLQTLNLRDTNLSSTSVINIFQSLEHNTCLKTLEISCRQQSQNIFDGEAAGCAIKRMLDINTTLETLKLQDCSVNDPDVRDVSGLTKNTSLKSKSTHSFSEEIVTNILSSANSHPCLCNIHVCGAYLSREHPQGVWTVNQKLSGIDRTTFFRYSRLSPQFFSALTESSMCSKFNVQLPHTLNLSNTDLTSSSVVSILRLLECTSGVVELDLSGNNLGAEHDNEAFDDPMKQMLVTSSDHCASSLQTLNLRDTNLSSTSVVNIFQSLEHNTCLKTLEISCRQQSQNIFDGETAGCAIKRMLDINTTLETLKLQDCSVNDPDVRDVSGLTKNTSLKSKSTHSFSEEIVTNILSSANSHPCLCNIHVCGAYLSREHPQGVWTVDQELSVINRATFFRYFDSRLSPQFFTALIESSMCSNVQLPHTLNLSNTDLTSSSVVSILRLWLERTSGVVELDLSGNNLGAEHDNEAFDDAMKQMLVTSSDHCASSLQTLNLRDTNLSSTSVVNIFQSLEHNTCLKTLEISCRQQSQNIFDGEAAGCAIKRMLDINTTLKTLELQDCSVNDPDVRDVSGLTNNTSLKSKSTHSFSEEIVTNILSSANSHPCLCNIHVCGAYLSREHPQGVWTVDQELSVIDRTTFFRYFDSRLSPQFFSALIESSMCSNVQLPHTLNLSNTDLTSSSVVSILRLWLERTSGVVKLDLSGNNLGAEHDNEAFDDAMKQMLVTSSDHCASSLQTLNLRDTNLSSTSVVNIFQSLEHNTHLKTLEISFTDMWLQRNDGEAIGCAIKRMLEVNTTLKYLDLHLAAHSNNYTISQITREGLTKNTSMKRLNIGGLRLV